MKIIRRDNDRNNTVYTPIRSLFDDFLRFPQFEDTFFPTTQGFRSLSADVWEKDNNVFVKMAIPGIKEDQLKIVVENDNVTISGSNHNVSENEDSGKKYYYRSFESSFEQTFRLPCSVDVDKSQAVIENGVVTITLPKAEKEKSKEVKIVKKN
jgi:HSP20 family protein